MRGYKERISVDAIIADHRAPFARLLRLAWRIMLPQMKWISVSSHARLVKRKHQEHEEEEAVLRDHG